MTAACVSNASYPAAVLLLCLFALAAVADRTPACGSNSRCCEINSLLRSAGFDAATSAKLVATAWHESNWGARKYGRVNSDGSQDFGLLQINSFLGCSRSGRNNDCCCPGTYPACKRNSALRRCACLCSSSCEAQVRSDALNVQCARRVFSSGCGGLNCWYGYKSNRGDANSYRVTCGGQTSGGAGASAGAAGSVGAGATPVRRILRGGRPSSRNQSPRRPVTPRRRN